MKELCGTATNDAVSMYWSQTYDVLLMDTGMVRAPADLMPLKLLIQQAGVAGYLLLLGNPLALVTIRQRAEGYDAIDGSAVIQILYAAVCFAYAGRYLTSPMRRDALRVLLSNPVVFLLLYIVLCGVSALWSPNPAYTVFMAFQTLAFLMLVVAALYEVNCRCSAQDVIEWALLWVLWAIFWAIVLYTRWYGLRVFLYPFGFTKLLPGAFFFLALYLSKRRLFAWVVVAFAVLSISRTNYFGILPGLLSGAVLGDRKSKILGFMLACVLVVAALSYGAEAVVQNTLFLGKEGIGWEYTTGRDRLWTMGWQLCMEQPLVGYGFIVGERDILMKRWSANVISMHSVFFSAFMGVGFMGPLLLLFYFLGTCTSSLRKTIPPSWRFAFVVTVFMVVVVSAANPGLGGRVYGAWLPSVIVMTMIAILCKGRARDPVVWERPAAPSFMPLGQALRQGP